MMVYKKYIMISKILLKSGVLDQEKRDKFFRDEDRNNKIFQGIVEVSSNSLLEQFAAKSLIS